MCRGSGSLRIEERRDDHVTTMTLEHHAADERPTGGALAALSLAALGVVYGDIGTSPIYAMRESLHGVHGVAPSAANVLGLLSLILWALILVISIKYLVFVMRADNC